MGLGVDPVIFKLLTSMVQAEKRKMSSLSLMIKWEGAE